MKYWGLCLGYYDDNNTVKIRLSNDLYCAHWMILILAHEMAHQYQWEVEGPKRKASKKAPLISHGPSFFIFKDKLKAYGIPLKTLYSTKNWFKHQKLKYV
jgi:hypothetical protein